MVTWSRKQYFPCFRSCARNASIIPKPSAIQCRYHAFTPSSSSLYVLLMYLRVRRLLSGWISQAMICEKARTYARSSGAAGNNFGPG